MHKTQKISVIIPNYNSGDYIREALDSILDQQYPNIEIFIQDNCSNDNSINIIKSYVDKYYNIYVAIEKDGGQSDALNKLLKRTKGDIICWLNADDKLDRNAFSVVLEAFEKNNADLVLGKCKQINENSEVLREEPSFFISWVHLLFYGNTIAQMSTFIKKRVFDECGEFNPKLYYAMDYDFWLRAMRKFKVVQINSNLSFFRIHSHSKSKHLSLASVLKSYIELQSIRVRYFPPIIILSPVYLLLDIYRFIVSLK